VVLHDLPNKNPHSRCNRRLAEPQRLRWTSCMIQRPWTCSVPQDSFPPATMLLAYVQEEVFLLPLYAQFSFTCHLFANHWTKNRETMATKSYSITQKLCCRLDFEAWVTLLWLPIYVYIFYYSSLTIVVWWKRGLLPQKKAS